MSAAAAARRRRQARDPYRKGAQLAPVQRIEPVICVREGCGDPRLTHRNNGQCLRAGCGCTEYVEAS